jgi:hypothetical protein
MGVCPMSSSRGLRNIGPMWALASSSDNILVFASAIFLNSNTSLSMYLFCNSRIHVITLYFGPCMCCIMR